MEARTTIAHAVELGLLNLRVKLVLGDGVMHVVDLVIRRRWARHIDLQGAHGLDELACSHTKDVRVRVFGELPRNELAHARLGA